LLKEREMEVKPQGSRLYIERLIEDASAKQDEIIYQDEDFKAPSSLKVKVLAVGPEADYEVGQILLVSQFAPTEAKIKPGDVNRFIVPAEDVLAIVESNEVSE
jgi:co-chaperonin GroES (HSP10)